MIEDYESINKMTDAQAAEVLENMRIRIDGGRGNGKTRLFYSYNVAMQKAIHKLKDGWIPIKMRPGTDEEYEEFCKYEECPREDFRVFECSLPDDGVEVLITTKYGYVAVSTFYNDDCAYFEGYEDDGEVVAWMPLPEAYKKETDEK